MVNRKRSKRELAAIHAKTPLKIIANKQVNNINSTGISKPRYHNPPKNSISFKENSQESKRSLLEKITPNKIEASVTPIPGVNLKATWELKSSNSA